MIFRSPVRRIQLLVAFMCLALVMYLLLLGRTAVLLIGSGPAAAVALGAALLIMPLIGGWALIATLRDGFTQHKLARLIADEGMELDISALPKKPSGRIDRAAADELFRAVRAELEAAPEDWRRWYRLARAYGYAGDRRRAHRAMRAAEQLRDPR